MQTHSRDSKESREKKSGSITERDRSEMWKAHMQGVLEQNPAYAGCTVLMRRKNRTYRFIIPAMPIPTVENPVNDSKPSTRKPKATQKRKSKP